MQNIRYAHTDAHTKASLIRMFYKLTTYQIQDFSEDIFDHTLGGRDKFSLLIRILPTINKLNNLSISRQQTKYQEYKKGSKQKQISSVISSRG